MKQTDFYKIIEGRRSIRSVSDEPVVSDERLEEIIARAVKHTPTAYNSQSGRVVLLLGDQHKKLWDITEATLQKIVPAENFKATQERLAGYRNGYGTVLFYEDQDVVKEYEEKFPLYKDRMHDYSMQGQGMLQYVIWTSLHVEGLGASLQHYNPLIDEEVQKTWDIPSSWKLIAQMPFGKPATVPAEKQFESVEKRIRVFK